jgi:hypothetical protein
MIDLDPYKAKEALERASANITRALVEARGAALEAGAAYAAQEDGDLDELQDWRTAEGTVTGLAEARRILDDAIAKAKGSCRWCGGPDDHGQDCRPAPYGTQPTTRRIR